jgi:ubiquinone/menaquinone biosynthesis C-methylase UbiE
MRGYMKKSRKFWNLHAEKYDAQVLKKYKDAYKNTIELSKQYLKSNHIILDYACGTGITTIELSENVKNICAIDIADKMIHIAKQKSINKGVRNIDFKVGDLSDIEKTGAKFDVILAYNILYFSKDIEKVLYQINNLLFPSGVFLSATDCFGENKDFKMLITTFLSRLGLLPFMKSYTTKELEKVIAENGFKIIKTQNLHNGHPPNYFIAAEKVKMNE